jgi:hypothetical protein
MTFARQRGDHMKRILAVAMMGMLTAPAYSQMNMNSGHKTPLQLKYEREDRERAESERTYNETMKRLKAQPPAATKSDPWAGVRSTPAEPSTSSRR